MRDPQTALFDEPFSNLGAKTRVKMRAEIKKLHKHLGQMMIYVTYDQTETMTMADTIVALNNGGIAQMGAPLDIKKNPVSNFVVRSTGPPDINCC